MSSSKGIDFSESELEALNVWRLPDVPKSGEMVGNPSSSMPQLTVNEIESMQKQAYDEAFAQGKDEGFQQGFEQGLKDGARKGYEDNVELLNQKANEFISLMKSLSEPFKTLDEEVENELVKLTIAIATQIIRREIKLDPGQVIAAVREAINVLPLSSQKIMLYLHPEDAGLVRSVLSLDEMSTPWGITEDPLITRGGCRVDTDVSHVNATVENRLAAVVATILGGERERDKHL
ncbi:flagellar assembly protein FliH/type III secretion system HrpE [Methyloglobulus morosus KoM1]|uniref:Flagellar assembly protein FliH n=1 Tax=Methyloglobulus morosus KoM1 TaxID=1116472 RepID=V5C4C2_9GAMM|nr:flagellar assembly protein FliH [Methyloglobulus morosus]ESS73332.1 flagellar assembly protein FliH/type III secretion system HrpE [Methyloglobulus morosus KoM1]